MLEKEKYVKARKKLQNLYNTFKGITELQEEKEELIDRKSKLHQLKTKFKLGHQTCNTLSDNIVSIDEQINEIDKEKQKILSPKYKAKWDKYRKKLNKIEEYYHNKLGELEDYDWLITDPLGNNGIKAYLFDSSLNILSSSSLSLYTFNRFATFVEILFRLSLNSSAELKIV